MYRAVYAAPVQQIARPLALVAAGGLAGAVTHRTVQRTDWPNALWAAFLVLAAVTYRVADLRGSSGPARSRERAAVGATLAAGVASSLVSGKKRRNVLAAGWLSHAVFDAVHHRSSTSQLPGWYPAVCAGFDVAVARALALETAAG